MTAFNPLAELRRQGFDADLHQGQVRVWPRHKVRKALAMFVTANLPAITQALAAEDNMKSVNNVLLWDLPVPVNAGNSEPPAGAIPEHLNGQRFAGIPAPGA
ncbi:MULTISPECIES: hypothetical protein [Methylomonas]|uniref:hypothetical protein n=1 Tax=Methylomonas TaxID=416 RepID=UPI0007C90F50|nr:MULTISPECIES: hypothetical protein [Methylomonas]ANE54769.1 hypothetical protein AYM39_05945 [Methylomonas sp. DH-1]WNB74846.1 hypothetical protein RI210_16375 [Methylomonas koyamae]